MKKNADNIFNDLATLSEAGISTLEAARRVAQSHPDIKAWSQVVSQLSKGHSLASSLNKKGLVSDYELEIISVAEQAGRLPQGLRGIAESYDKRRQRISKLKSKLYLPLSILFVSIIVSAIITTSGSSDAPILGVLATAVIKVLFALLVTKFIVNLLRNDSSSFINQIEIFYHTGFYKHLYEQMVFGALLWNLKSGIDFKTAFNRISRLLKSKASQEKLRVVSRECAKGAAVCDSIEKAELPITNDFKQVLKTAESSGKWEEAIKIYLQHQLILLDIQIDNAFEWAPRAFYMVIVVIAITVIL